MKLVILDRDGVINVDSADYIKTPDEWHPIPGSIDAIARLHQAGYTVAIATNQAGIARQLYDHAMLARIHQKMLEQIQAAGGDIELIVYCPHHPDKQCACRKPAPGLLHQIEERLGVSVKDAPFVGDSLKDLQAGTALSCQPVLVKTGHGQETLSQLKTQPDINARAYEDLAAFVEDFLA